MKIEIEYTEEKGWVISKDDKYSDKLGWDEMIGLVTQLTMPEEKRCLQWMRTKEEHQRQEDFLNNLIEKNKCPKCKTDNVDSLGASGDLGCNECGEIF